MADTRSSHPPVVMWFRRDLRLTANQALSAASADGGPVVPVFVDDPAFDRSGAPRRAYLREALAALDRSMGGALIVRRGDPVAVLPGLVSEMGASTVYVSRDYGPYGRRRDAAVIAVLREAGVRVVAAGSPYAVDPGTVVKADGKPYAVFTPFARAWATHESGLPLDEPDVDWRSAPDVISDGLPARPAHDCRLPAIGEDAAEQRWTEFHDGPMARYRTDRNRPDLDGTSRLSADLRWGVVHPTQLLAELGGDAGASAFANELAWREFYADVLFHQPESAWHNLNRKLDALPVDTDADARARFRRWASGTTGFPIVDAGMRQLLAIGWMHNRVRMIVASFLVKDLHLPWQWGARHFMQHLIDGDLASNSHGWQWAAGTGTDAAPYFRVFNPITQSEKFDPDGRYIREWLPELGGIGDRSIHAPVAARPDGYPPPMVDHAEERREALARFGASRS